jgi:hypothetical protein
VYGKYNQNHGANMKTLITGAVGACLLLSIGAGAQAQPAHVPAVVANSEPRFELEALGVRALNENGLDWPFSDKVKVHITVPAYRLQTLTEEMSVDAGWWYSFISHKHRCILPIAGLNPKVYTFLRGDEGQTWSCSDGGAPGPFSFRVSVIEMDPFWTLCSGFAGCETLGLRTISYSMEELLGLHVGQVLEESIRLIPPPCPAGADVCEATDAEYIFQWRITRLPDALLPTPPILDH